jgi:hypothetical protein
LPAPRETINGGGDKIKSAYGSLVGVEEAKAALREAASWNAWAATATSIALCFKHFP